MFSQDITIYGEYANYIKKYSRDTSAESKVLFTVLDHQGDSCDIYLFETLMQAFLVAAMIGIIENKEIPYLSSGDQSARIFSEKVQKTRYKLERIAQFMILTDDSYGNIDERIKKAFTVNRADERDIEIRMRSFAQGGLEIINDRFKECKTKEDVVFEIQNLNSQYSINDIN